MIYKLLSLLFKRDTLIDRYTPYPWHVVYPIAVMGVGVFSFKPGWEIFSVIVFIFGVLLGAAILICILWDKSIEYWEKIAFVFEAAGHVKDAVARAEILRSMGYNVMPDQLTITERREDEHGVFSGASISKLPISTAVLQAIADKALTSDLSFTQSEYSHFVPDFRRVQKVLKKEKLIVPKNSKNVRKGYVFNRKGVDVLYPYASESVKLLLKEKEKKNGSSRD